ncbi:helix-turn-helix domain-containing protein [Streptomyces lavendulae]|uniref:helix-turn-helix domain-containing protein n=1 Tax=Streptomyces lavendulae TaxID=1914 RepID=UPI0024A4800F|nr:helix-turn-helix transcriptional regulator [Streptomyces lavendulae]GLX21160.1 transcriptional regulator [Streptomyces lavendulae subsp. lavendulae]GLX25556.1 transcriptional regulator [Streptomyces lavendulae subsp. lavendulae]
MPPKKRPRANATTMKMIGSQVAAARVAKGLTQRQLADLVKLDEETVASIEQGRRALMPNVAELLDFHLGLPNLLTVAALELPSVDTTPPWAAEYLALESEANSLCWYASQLLPGLLQTEGYARALFNTRVPAHTKDKIDALTAQRMARHEILRRESPPAMSFVIWEPAVRLRLGGATVHKEQLRQLISDTELPNVSIQVMPLEQASHSGLDGPFTILETPAHQHLGYIESQRSSRLFHDANEVSILAHRYAMLRTQALNTAQSRGLLERMLGEL